MENLQNNNGFTLPPLSNTLKKLKADFTLEKQYDTLIDYDQISTNDSDRVFLQSYLENNGQPAFSLKESKGIACFLGLIIGDSLGNITDGFPLDYNRTLITSFNDYKDLPRLPLGLFSDDSAMALCIADSLIASNYQYYAKDIKYRFLLWWYEGLNNGKAILKKNPEIYQAKIPFDYYSFGIGTTVWCSLLAFIKDCTNPYVDSQNSIMPKQADGNGSIMRLAPIVLAFYKEKKKLTEISRDQSFLTHYGEEAAQCCQFLANLLALFIEENGENANILSGNIEERKKFLKGICKKASINGEITHSSVLCLAESVKENEDENRDWDWMNENFKYSKERSLNGPAFIGVYCMDCLAMALNIVLYSKNFKDALVKSVNLGGDADTLAAVVGQIAGSLYGIDEELLRFYKVVRLWDQEKTIVRAFKLINSKV